MTCRIFWVLHSIWFDTPVWDARFNHQVLAAERKWPICLLEKTKNVEYHSNASRHSLSSYKPQSGPSAHSALLLKHCGQSRDVSVAIHGQHRSRTMSRSLIRLRPPKTLISVTINPWSLCCNCSDRCCNLLCHWTPLSRILPHVFQLPICYISQDAFWQLLENVSELAGAERNVARPSNKSAPNSVEDLRSAFPLLTFMTFTLYNQTAAIWGGRMYLTLTVPGQIQFCTLHCLFACGMVNTRSLGL